jgi:phosphopantetheinyl transferase
MPMTGTVELIIEAAAALIPELVVVEVRSVRALRPLVAAPATALTIEATEQPTKDPAGRTLVSVVLDGTTTGPNGKATPSEHYARATVVLAEAYPAPPALPDPPLTGERPSQVDAEALYRDRWMFHGPAFRGVEKFTAIADDGVRGRLCTLEAPGSLLDAAGQLLGYWVAVQPENAVALPVTIDSIAFFGPPVVAGTCFDSVVRIRSVDATEITADLEMRDDDGVLWCHTTGWTDRRLEGNTKTLAAFRFPARSLLTEAQPGGWHLLTEPWTDPVARDVARRQYLAEVEEAEHSTRNPRAARHWFLGRVAAKDAVRAHLWANGAGPIFPAEIQISNDPSGAPRVAGPGTDGLHLSLAHSGLLAVAIVGTDGPVGIDVEQISDVPAESALLTPAERELLETLAPAAGDPALRAAWVTRFWTAKEAVAKAAGTGLGGRPARFVVTRVDSDRLLVVTGGVGRWVTTTTGEFPVPYAVGWTQEPDIAGPDLGH